MDVYGIRYCRDTMYRDKLSEVNVAIHSIATKRTIYCRNTYSLLNTERLIGYGEVDDTKSGKGVQMILNHKDAIELIVQSAEEIGFNWYTLCLNKTRLVTLQGIG